MNMGECVILATAGEQTAGGKGRPGPLQALAAGWDGEAAGPLGWGGIVPPRWSRDDWMGTREERRTEPCCLA